MSRSVSSVIIMCVAAFAGFFLGICFSNAVGGMIWALSFPALPASSTP